MATFQAVDGTSAVTATSTRNNRGVVRHGGTIGGDKFVANVIAETIDTRVGNNVNNGANIDVALSGGTYNSQVAGSYVMKKVTTTLAGVANTTLLSGAADFGVRRPIAFVESIRTSFLTTWSWTSTGEGALSYSGTVTTTNNSYGTDNAARPTYAIPGTLTYRDGSALPVESNYSAKTNN